MAVATSLDVVPIDPERFITNEDMAEAVKFCEGEFRNAMRSAFPQVTTDTIRRGQEDLFRGIAKGFIKKWLETNAQIRVGHWSEFSATFELENCVQQLRDDQVEGTNERGFTITNPMTPDTLTLKVVALEAEGKDRGFGVLIRDNAVGTHEIATGDSWLAAMVETARVNINRRIHAN